MFIKKNDLHIISLALGSCLYSADDLINVLYLKNEGEEKNEHRIRCSAVIDEEQEPDALRDRVRPWEPKWNYVISAGALV